MCKDSKMCQHRMQTEDLLEMLSSIIRKKVNVRGNLRLEAVLESTYKWLDRELKAKQQNRKRKWEELKTDFCKKSRRSDDLDVTEMEDDSTCDELLACQISFTLSVIKNLCGTTLLCCPEMDESIMVLESWMLERASYI